jgi:hypothetical protein
MTVEERSIYFKEYYQKNKEHIKETRKQYIANNADWYYDRHRKYQKTYYYCHKTKIKKYYDGKKEHRHQYYLANKEKSLAYNKMYREKNHDKMLAYWREYYHKNKKGDKIYYKQSEPNKSHPLAYNQLFGHLVKENL